MTDEEYENLLERVRKGAEYLDNPLLKPEQREKAMQLYDSLVSEVRRFRRVETHGYDYETEGVR